jgi:hypothetical protein
MARCHLDRSHDFARDSVVCVGKIGRIEVCSPRSQAANGKFGIIHATAENGCNFKGATGVSI